MSPMCLHPLSPPLTNPYLLLLLDLILPLLLLITKPVRGRDGTGQDVTGQDVTVKMVPQLSLLSQSELVS